MKRNLSRAAAPPLPAGGDNRWIWVWAFSHERNTKGRPRHTHTPPHTHTHTHATPRMHSLTHAHAHAHANAHPRARSPVSSQTAQPQRAQSHPVHHHTRTPPVRLGTASGATARPSPHSARPPPSQQVRHVGRQLLDLGVVEALDVLQQAFVVLGGRGRERVGSEIEGSIGRG